MTYYKFIVYLAIALLMGSCAAPPSYRLLRSAPHKDVIHCLVFLPKRGTPEMYQRIALDEVSKIRAGEARRQYPLYEISFEFHRDSPEGEILAQVFIVLDRHLNVTNSTVTAQPKIETVVY